MVLYGFPEISQTVIGDAQGVLEIFKVDKGVANITINCCGCHIFLLALLLQLSHILWFLFSADTISLYLQ